MNEQCKDCGWLWEKCDEHLHCDDCPINNVEIDGHKWCYCNSIASKRSSSKCPYFVPRKESSDEDDTEM